MDITLGLAVPAAVILVISLALRRFWVSTWPALWLLAWTALYTSGVLVQFEPAHPWLRLILSGLATLFAGLLYSGARVFAGRSPANWVIGASLLAGVSRGGLHLAGFAAPSLFFGGVLESILELGAAHLVWQTGRRRAGHWSVEGVVALLFVGLACLEIYTGWRRSSGVAVEAITLFWAAASVITITAQLLLLVVHAREREQEAHEAVAAQSAQLAGEDARLRAVVNVSPVGFLVLDERGESQLVNEAALALLPEFVAETRTSENFVDRLERCRFPDGTAFDAQTWLAEVHTQGASEAELIGPPPGSPRFVIGARSLTEPGARRSILVVLNDRTEQSQIEERARQATKMRVVARMAGGVAHDLNDDLTVVLGNVQHLLEGKSAGDDETSLHEALQDILTSAEHCAALTQGLRSFASRGRPRPGSVALGASLAKIVRLLSPLARGVRVEWSIEPDTPRVLADPTQLEQALFNLGLNALQATPPGGLVALVGRPAPPSGTSSSAQRGVEIEVRDNGCGIAPELLPRVFEPFFTTKPDGTGVGLGLSVVYGIATANQATIHLESRPGGGTSAFLGFPAALEADVRERAIRPAGRAPSGTVLVADDEPGVRRMLRRMLGRLGYATVLAADGDEAIALFETNPDGFVAVLIDLSMPGCDGLSALSRVLELRPDVPAVLMSGYFDREQRADLPEGVALLAKPFDARALADLLNRPTAALKQGGAGD